MKKWVTGLAVLAVVTVGVCLSWKPVVLWLYITRSSVKHPQELASARLFCQRILTNDAPTAEWLSTVDDWDRVRDKTNYFYSLKVHFVECQTSLAHLRRARIWVFDGGPTNASAYFYYQRHTPCLYLTFRKVRPDDWRIMATFPLNNCLFDPDVNKDGLVDQKDVELAREEAPAGSDSEIDVYAAVLGQYFKRPWWRTHGSYMVVRECSGYTNNPARDRNGNPTNVTYAEWAQIMHKRLPGISDDTISNYVQNSTGSPRLLRDGVRLGISCRLINRADVEALARSPKGLFYALMKRQRGFAGLIEFSRVGFNHDHTEALVYVAYYAGSLDGSGDYCLLRKVGGKWVFISSSMVWIS